ncbi:MAG: nitronate monooxygenase [Candidatus Sabulitectum sp.]|nr:nitronate monooxygenase [Candidatus Sabulitectum sp.]
MPESNDVDSEILKKVINDTRRRTKGLFGLNIMMAISDFNDHLKVAIEEKVAIVFIGAGLPLRVPEIISVDRARSCFTNLVPKISSSRAAKAICKFWDSHYSITPDAIVLEGPMAGGHLGFAMENINNPDYCLEVLLPEVINTVKPYEQKYGRAIPVIAAGGIFSGGDISKFLEMGAKGVKMGTRFVATKECDVDSDFKQVFLNCRKEDLVLINSPVGLPGRAINSKFLTDLAKGIRKPLNCLWKCLKTCDLKNASYCIAEALSNARMGDLDNGFAFAGANAFRIKEIVSVKELMAVLVDEFNSARGFTV